MPPDWGYCPEVAQRGNALILPNVAAKPRFNVNPVVERLGIQAYVGAPLIHTMSKDQSLVLGTVCFVGTTPMPWESRHRSRALIWDYVRRVLPSRT
ncbi:hypothetical protein SMD44_p10132 (plasmid) [Streptomyces alboflavus]|uniref:GAF domain-containing protein n=1 Tax=Streptomyces alboflavus TaxID=67267 RepID=A0A291W4R0_9ACTN|nr:GAF domain-containing protein [Streptomyces alboflavus]ATM24631.1 hypothetical protein SMD44_p10132 [Streptomyces alboflavus]